MSPLAPAAPVVGSQDMEVDIVGDGAQVGEVGANICKDSAHEAKSRKGTFTATLDFGDFDDDIFL